MAEITRSTLKQLRPAIESALADVEKNFGIKLKLANCKYTSVDFTFQLKGEVLDTGDGESVAERDWKTYSAEFGLDTVKFGSVFESSGRRFRITGIKITRPKYPVSAVDVSTGKGFKFPVSSVLRAA